MEIHQIIDTATPGDAIFNDALGIRAQLRQFTTSEIICDRVIHPGLAGECVGTEDFVHRQRRRGLATTDDVLIVHASIGNEDQHKWVMSRPERLVVRYHNITPSRYFTEISPMFVELLDRGRDQLYDLAARAIAALPVSRYNAEELPAYGFGGAENPIHVVPLFFPHGDFDGIARRPPAIGDPPVVLFVGQFLPHKRPDLLVQAFHVLTSYMDPRSHLVIVGQMRAEAYGQAVRAIAHDLVLPNVHFRGIVSQPELIDHFQSATVLVNTSEHEGFSAPVVEAMTAGVPVIARRFGAIAETVGAHTPEGPAALLLEPEDDALMIAEAIWEVATNADLNRRLTERGRHRSEAFHPVRTAERFIATIGSVLL